MNGSDERVCPVSRAGGLDNRIRRWLQNPRRLLAPYVRDGMTAVDIGCGPGFFTGALASLVGPSGRVIAVDLQAGMPEKLRAKLEGTSFSRRVVLHQAKSGSLELSASVQFVLAFNMLHEVPDQTAFLSEVRGLLAPTGHLLVVEPPLHVSRAAFEASLATAKRVGLEVVDRPHVAFSKAALLRPGKLGEAGAQA